MSSLGSPNPFFIAGKKAYEVERSLRFNDGDSPSLTRSPSGDGNKQTFTFSWWQKITQPSDSQYPITFSVGANSITTGFWEMRIGSLGLYLRFKDSSTVVLNSYDRFRDSSAWYHCVIAVDTTKATNSERIKMYVNNRQITSFQYENYPSQNLSFRVNTTDQHQWGYGKSSSGGIDGPLDSYLAEINFIDGFQYDPSYFGETNSVTGQWNPKKYTGSYGTNGYYLNFSDNSGTTATTLGKDESGNGNNWTPNNFSVAAGVDNDSLEDTPTNNFPTLNPLDTLQGTLSNGNLDYTTPTGAAQLWGNFVIPKTGKWFMESTMTDNGPHFAPWIVATNYLGLSDTTYTDSSVTYYINGQKRFNGSYSNYGATFTQNDVIGVAIDVDNNEVTYYKNGTSQGAISFTFASGVDYFFAASDGSSYGGASSSWNFGQRPFIHTKPTGFKTICSANLPEPTIKLPNQHFNTVLYTGNNNTSQNITGVGFSPDWVWVKNRDNVERHHLVDSVRGDNKVIFSSEVDIERTGSHGGGHTQLNLASDGFNLVSNGTNDELNFGSRTYVAWNWNAGDTDGKTYTVTVVSDSGNKYRFDGFGTSAVTLDLAEGGTYIFNYPSAHPFRFSTTSDGTHGGGTEYTTGVTVLSSTSVQIVVAASAPQLHYFCTLHSGMGGAINTNSTLGSSNFDGSIQTTVKVNAQAGFSIISHVGSGAVGTIGHGLGVKPDAIFFKNRTQAHGWLVYHSSNGATKNLSLSNNAAMLTANNKFNDTEPTSSVITLKTAADSNQSGQSIISYCFSEVEGYSKFGKYTGNGSSDGRFVYTGFKVTWLLIKKTNTSESWILADTKRNSQVGRESPADSYLLADVTNAESTGIIYDMLSNGFKFRSTSQNTSGHTYVYFAFAEAPFKNARAR